MKERPHLIPALIASGLLFAALLRMPYPYYEVLRWVICGISIYVAYKAYKWDKKWAIWVFAVCAILFNPIRPIGFSREQWQPLDAVFGILFIISIITLREPVVVPAVSTNRTKERKPEEGIQQRRGINYCPNCGYKLTGASNYCPNCGVSISAK
jgi:hypothetical protein